MPDSFSRGAASETSRDKSAWVRNVLASVAPEFKFASAGVCVGLRKPRDAVPRGELVCAAWGTEFP
eukprot:1720814-Pyramimonas_sp.AAC.1